jgi:hypothetical protein
MKIMKNFPLLTFAVAKLGSTLTKENVCNFHFTLFVVGLKQFSLTCKTLAYIYTNLLNMVQEH